MAGSARQRETFFVRIKISHPPTPLFTYCIYVTSDFNIFIMDPANPLAFEGLDVAALQATRSRRDMNIQACVQLHQS